ncbi:FkbM family methyltransferase [Rhizobium sp. G187]|uniref:FkbM family methyltransferase n=1 Tax=Rhizobium sp. G187 TaxID=3451352 RepID=UPI003EE5A09F
MMFISYAQNFEDVMLWRALKHIKSGFYLDIGAQDPVIDSVSRSFYEKGWRGVHLEPTSEYAQKLRENRPDETILQNAVSLGKGNIQFFEFPETGLSTGNPDIARQHKERGFLCRETFVEQVLLSEILDRYSDRDIHWMKIDVEGMEGAVLESWGSSASRPWIVVIEATAPTKENRVDWAWHHQLFDRGYELCYFDGLNCYFVSSEHLDLKASFQVPPNVFDEFAVSGMANSRIAELLNNRIDTLSTQHENLKIKLVEALLQKDKLVHSSKELEKSHRELECVIQELYNSTSWKITSPLRAIRLRARWLQDGMAAWATLRPGTRPRRIMQCLLTHSMLWIRSRPRLARFLLKILRLSPVLQQRLILAAQARGMALSLRPTIPPGMTAWNLDVEPELIKRFEDLDKE